MGKWYPLGGYVLYLDCLECAEKVCKGGHREKEKGYLNDVYKGAKSEERASRLRSVEYGEGDCYKP